MYIDRRDGHVATYENTLEESTKHENVYIGYLKYAGYSECQNVDYDEKLSKIEGLEYFLEK